MSTKLKNTETLSLAMRRQRELVNVWREKLTKLDQEREFALEQLRPAQAALLLGTKAIAPGLIMTKTSRLGKKEFAVVTRIVFDEDYGHKPKQDEWGYKLHGRILKKDGKLGICETWLYDGGWTSTESQFQGAMP